MSSFFIWYIARAVAAAFAGSGSSSQSKRAAGTTCQETPNRSLSQPHWTSWPPFSVRRPQ
jgi:hypothetical protein